MRRLSFVSFVSLLSTGCAGLLGLDDFAEGEASGSGGAGSAQTGTTSSSSSSSGAPTSSSTEGVGGSGNGAGGPGTGTGGDGGGGGTTGALEVTPGDEVKVGILRSLQFSANEAVTWEVSEPEGGSIDEDGFYVSPDEAGTFHVVATSTDDPSESVTVTLNVVPLGTRVFGGIPGGPGTLDGSPSRARVVRPGGMAMLQNNRDFVFSDANANTLRVYDRQDDEVTTLAGVPFEAGAADGIGAAARFDGPGAVVAAASGSRVFVADRNNFCIRDVNVATGQVATLSGSCGVSGSTDAGTGAGSRFDDIRSMARSPDGGSLYVCSLGNSVRSIRRVDIATGGTTTLITGLNSCSLGVDLFNQHVYFVNGQDQMLKRFDATPVFDAGTIEDVAPLPEDSFFADGIAVDTGFGGAREVYVTVGEALWRFHLDDGTFDATPLLAPDPIGYVDGELATAQTTGVRTFVTYPPQGALYFADDDAFTIREILLDQEDVSTVIGIQGSFESVDGAKSVARLLSPFGAALDEDGNGYVISLGEGADNTIRRVDGVTGAIETFSGVRGFEGDLIDGPADVARFGILYDVVRVGDALYVVDAFASTIRSVSLADGSVSTVAGSPQDPGYADGVGAAAKFDFQAGAGIATDGADLYIAEGTNHVIRKLDLSSGAVTTIAGGIEGSNDGNGLEAQFVAPVGLTFDRGTLYIVDIEDHTIRRMDLASGDVTTVLGIPGVAGQVDGGVGVATFSSPFRVAADGIGNLYVTGIAEDDVGAGTIRRVALDGPEALPFAGNPTQFGLSTGPLPGTLGCPSGMVIDPAGDLLFGDRCDGAVVAIRPL